MLFANKLNPNVKIGMFYNYFVKLSRELHVRTSRSIKPISFSLHMSRITRCFKELHIDKTVVFQNKLNPNVLLEFIGGFSILQKPTRGLHPASLHSAPLRYLVPLSLTPMGISRLHPTHRRHRHHSQHYENLSMQYTENFQVVNFTQDYLLQGTLRFGELGGKQWKANSPRGSIYHVYPILFSIYVHFRNFNISHIQSLEDEAPACTISFNFQSKINNVN